MENTAVIKVPATSPAEAELKAKAIQEIALRVDLNNLLYLGELVKHPKFNQGFGSKTTRALIKGYL